MIIYKNFECKNCEEIKNIEKNAKKQAKNNKFKRFLFKFFIFLLILITLIFLFFKFCVNPQIIYGNTAKIKLNATNLINVAVQNSINQNQYDNLISIEKNSNNEIVLISVNSLNANSLANSLVTLINKNLAAKNLSYSIPLGSFSGIPALSSLGPDVEIKISTIGFATAKFKSQISSISINQSYHKIYIVISVSVAMFLPFHQENIIIKNQVLIAENIIVGKIPTTYLNTDNLTNALNLIPS